MGTLSCIFKVFDDCRQDVLAIQVIQALKGAFDASGTGLALFPYQVIPLRVNADKAPGGIIECVPDVKSRDEVRICVFVCVTPVGARPVPPFQLPCSSRVLGAQHCSVPWPPNPPFPPPPTHPP